MKKSKTSIHYFKYSCTDVYNAVTTDTGDAGVSITPLADEIYDAQTSGEISDGRMYARVTDRTPGKSCAYEMKSQKFTLYWSATFEEVQGECRMTLTEIYDFNKGAVLPYILAQMFIKQKQQHKEFFRSVEDKLRLKEFRETSKKSLKNL